MSIRLDNRHQIAACWTRASQIKLKLRVGYMSGYCWAKTAENELFVVLVVNGMGYIPGVESGIDLAEFVLLEPVKWPSETQNQSFAPMKHGAPALAATHECVILPFAANG